MTRGEIGAEDTSRPRPRLYPVPARDDTHAWGLFNGRLFMAVLSAVKQLNRMWTMKSELQLLVLSLYLSGLVLVREKQQEWRATSLSASRVAAQLTHMSTNTHACQAEECVCGGLVGVNLHVNEMALSALVSDSKRVRARSYIWWFASNIL